MGRVVTYVALSAAGSLLVVGVGRSLRERTSSGHLVKRPRWLPISDATFRGLLRMRPMAGATIVVVLMVVAFGYLFRSTETNPLGGPAPTWVAIPGLVGILTGLMVCLGILLINQPRWLVPTALRDDRGTLVEWREERQRWRRGIRIAFRGAALAGAIPPFAAVSVGAGLIALRLSPVRSVIWSFALGVAGQGLYLLLSHPLVVRPGQSGEWLLVGEQYWPWALLVGGIALPVDLSWAMFSGVGGISLHVEADWIRQWERRRLTDVRAGGQNRSVRTD